MCFCSGQELKGACNDKLRTARSKESFEHPKITIERCTLEGSCCGNHSVDVTASNVHCKDNSALVEGFLFPDSSVSIRNTNVVSDDWRSLFSSCKRLDIVRVSGESDAIDCEILPYGTWISHSRSLRSRSNGTQGKHDHAAVAKYQCGTFVVPIRCKVSTSKSLPRRLLQVTPLSHWE